ncbi:hypothetical protein [Mycobacterium sp. AZCC_0083]|uniref:hypothetical protein n=1 Tax=Mycobacterium sp. AZCC_0083 TaxID=2735882 RepID=UPI00160C0940|nr:hypothetical protein [Mycobacterium sp. AZCC_0083]MBB5167155.1 hypothetical protein [Mycobacterium sp. AZCC_0083]
MEPVGLNGPWFVHRNAWDGRYYAMPMFTLWTAELGDDGIPAFGPIGTKRFEHDWEADAYADSLYQAYLLGWMP